MIKPDMKNIEEELKERKKNLSFITSMLQQDIWLTTFFLVIYFLFIISVNIVVIGKFFNFTIFIVLIVLGISINVIFALDTVMVFIKALNSARMIKEDKNKSFLDFLVFSHKMVKNDPRINILNICFTILFICTSILVVYFIIQKSWFAVVNFYLILILVMSFEMHRKKYRI